MNSLLKDRVQFLLLNARDVEQANDALPKILRKAIRKKHKMLSPELQDSSTEKWIQTTTDPGQ
eukprot:scaffold5194_cov118-Cylindrotheca_fusiformis.AAC.6